MKAKKTKKKNVKSSCWLTNNCLCNNFKKLWNWMSSKLDSTVKWVDGRKDKVKSLALILLGLTFLCPLVDPWTVVGGLVLAVGLVRSASAWSK